MKIKKPDVSFKKPDLSFKKPDLSSLKRPQLKGPSVPMPPFLTDLYKDLRDRSLLPFVVVLIVAILAVPFVFAEGSDSPDTAPVGESPIEAIKGAAEGTSTLSVIEATPGLRDYRRRLQSREPTDPFTQRYTAPVLKGAELNEPKTTRTTTAGDGTEGDGTGRAS